MSSITCRFLAVLFAITILAACTAGPDAALPETSEVAPVKTISAAVLRPAVTPVAITLPDCLRNVEGFVMVLGPQDTVWFAGEDCLLKPGPEGLVVLEASAAAAGRLQLTLPSQAGHYNWAEARPALEFTNLSKTMGYYGYYEKKQGMEKSGGYLRFNEGEGKNRLTGTFVIDKAGQYSLEPFRSFRTTKKLHGWFNIKLQHRTTSTI